MAGEKGTQGCFIQIEQSVAHFRTQGRFDGWWKRATGGDENPGWRIHSNKRLDVALVVILRVGFPDFGEAIDNQEQMAGRQLRREDRGISVNSMLTKHTQYGTGQISGVIQAVDQNRLYPLSFYGKSTSRQRVNN